MLLHGTFDHDTKEAVEFCVKAGLWPMGSRYYGNAHAASDWDFFDEFSPQLKEKFIKAGWLYQGPVDVDPNCACFFHKANVQVKLVHNLRIQIALRNCLRFFLEVFPKSFRPVIITTFNIMVQQLRLTPEEFDSYPQNRDKTINYTDNDFWRA